MELLLVNSLSFAVDNRLGSIGFARYRVFNGLTVNIHPLADGSLDTRRKETDSPSSW